MRSVTRSALSAALTGACLLQLSLSSTPARAQSGAAATILAAAREALGGAPRINGVKTFIANGRTQQVRGDNLIPIETIVWIKANGVNRMPVLGPWPASPSPPTASSPLPTDTVVRDAAGASCRHPSPPPGLIEAALRDTVARPSARGLTVALAECRTRLERRG